jgi:hypothetical protein
LARGGTYSVDILTAKHNYEVTQFEGFAEINLDGEIKLHPLCCLTSTAGVFQVFKHSIPPEQLCKVMIDSLEQIQYKVY